MCRACVEELVGDQHIDVTPSMELASQLIREWYDIPGFSTGGPFHIVLDDYNVATTHITWCESQVEPWLAEYAAELDPADVLPKAAELVRLLLPMSEAERAVTIANSGV